MAAEDGLSRGRSLSKPLRGDTLISEQRPFFASNCSKKFQSKAATDKLFWLSPAHSPLLSPARERVLQHTRKKVRHRSIFSIPSRGKGSIEGEEPTSPKVSCIGQVRVHRKYKDPFLDAAKKRGPRSRIGSMSPARFFMSAGRSTKWGSLFGSRKDSRSSTPRSSVYSEGEVSCFGWAFESRSMLHTDRTCAFLARSLNALHEYRSSEDICSIESCTDAQNNVYTVQTSERVDSDSLLTAIGEGCSSHMNEAYGHDRSCASLAVEGHDDEQKFSVQPEPCCSKESLVEDYNHDKPPKQKFMYNELPSLYCASSASQNMKISDDIVPETWLWRDCERLQTDTASHLSCGSKQSIASSREDSETAKQVEVNCPPSSSAKPQDFTRIAQAVYQRTGLHNPHVDVSCSHTECTTDDEPVTKHDETNNNLEVSSRIECRHSDTTLLPSFVNIPVALLKENREKFMGFSGFDEGIIHSDNREHKAFCKKLELEKGLQEPYHLKTSHRMMRQCVVDIGKEKYTIAFPQLYGKNQSPLSVEDGKQSWCIFKNRSRAYPPQSFSALILLGYNQSVSLKDVQNSDEEFLKGIFELGRLSFKGSSKYLQVLKADTAFNRSRSATSHRTLIRLQRCNSDPCRSSYWF